MSTKVEITLVGMVQTGDGWNSRIEYKPAIGLLHQEYLHNTLPCVKKDEKTKENPQGVPSEVDLEQAIDKYKVQ